MTTKQLIKILKKVPANTRVYIIGKREDIYDETVDNVLIQFEKRTGETTVYLDSDYINCGD